SAARHSRDREPARSRLLSRAPASKRGAGTRAARRRARARARQGHRDRRGHRDPPARHRAPHGEAAPARRVGRQGEGDGHRLVGGRSLPVAQERRSRARGAAAAARGQSGTRARDRGWVVSATGWYVYGVVDADTTLDDHGEDVRLVRDEALAAIVAPVDLAEFGNLTERLNDRAWLARKALDHETVLSRVAGTGPVVPLRFGAIYRRLDD